MPKKSSAALQQPRRSLRLNDSNKPHHDHVTVNDTPPSAPASRKKRRRSASPPAPSLNKQTKRAKKVTQSKKASVPAESSPEQQTQSTAPNGPPLYPEQHRHIPFVSDDPHSLPAHVTRIVTWNVASLRSVSKNGTFDAYLLREKPHILCVQETKMTDEAVESFKCPAGYSVHWFHSERKGYSGVAVFLRDGYVAYENDSQVDSTDGNDDDNNNANDKSTNSLVTITKIDHGINDSIVDSEGRVMTLHLKHRHCDSDAQLFLVVAYVPNSGGKLARLPYRTQVFEPALRDHLEKLKKSQHQSSVIYCGDLNVAHEEIDIHDSKSNKKSAGHTPEERKEFGVLLQHGSQWVDCYRALYPEFPGYTYYSRRFGARLRQAGKGWRLDYFVMDKATFDDHHPVVDCFVRPDTEGSDHYPLVLDVNMNKLFK